MPTFFSRRYMRKTEAVGSTEKVLGVVILLLITGIVAVFVVQVATDKNYLFDVDEAAYRVQDESRAVVAADPFPDPGVEGWRAPIQVSRYTPDNLYQKINGRSGAYLQFHVVGLAFGTYYHQSDTDRTADVYWYEMGEPVNAFGIYRSEASPDAVPVSIGRDGYQIGGAVFFWKGSSYVQVLPADLDLADAHAALKIAERLAERIKDTGEPFWASTVLPKSGRIADSLRYLATDAFSLDFLDDVFTAKYDVQGSRLTLFIHRAGDDSSAGVLLDQYVAFFEKYGKVIWRSADASRRIVAGDVSGHVDVVFAKGRYLGGVAGARDAGAARKAVAAFFDELTVSDRARLAVPIRAGSASDR